MKIAIVGASGAVGRHLVPRLIERGHQVRAIARNPERLARAAAAGAGIAAADILDGRSLVAAISGCDAAVHAATAIPSNGLDGDWSPNDRIRREGTANLLEACRATGIARYVQQSIAMLVPNTGDAWVDERDAIRADGVIRSSADMETIVAGSGADWRIVRGGAFYGPGTGEEEFWIEGLRGGTLRIPGDGTSYVSLIHVADYAEALALALESGDGRFIVNAVDDEPVQWGELLRALARQCNLPAPSPGGPPLNTPFRARNLLAKSKLGWRPFFASYRSGVLAQV